MVRKRNLTKEKIIKVSLLLADEIGLNQVTFQKIAEKLDIKYPSLYNHFNNMDDLRIEMTIYLLNELNLSLMENLIGKSGEDAIRKYAYAYRDFAFKNSSAYRLFVNVASTENEEINRLSRQTNNIMHQVLNFYIKDETHLIHKSRALRSLLHGFISLKFLGYFQNKVSPEESFQFMIDDFILSLSKITS
ncbi:TetR/AcrR family transcriptional regulator [Clostridium sp. Marseille-Q2269]|uniref:TetR/AcrR family transcriptional regulator n=1 Tax=Clostridium sp. Marseille-Q2269 TaxID=2942205 RepID=UPI0020749462|nr:TetR/AcrR family transcriptional regulator [Clostridium sp. Marseille-Q2269]